MHENEWLYYETKIPLEWPERSRDEKQDQGSLRTFPYLSRASKKGQNMKKMQIIKKKYEKNANKKG